MDYGAIIPIAAYFVAMQLATRANTKPPITTSVAVLIPYFISLVIRYIFESSAGHVLVSSLFSTSSIIIVIIQFFVGLYVFKRIRDDDSITSTILWSVGGFFLIVLLIPYIVGIIRF